MIIKGNPGGSVKFWSQHLMRDDTNEKAEVREITGLLAEDLPSALKEMEAIAAQSRCHGNFMYQANINPREGEHLTPQQWKEAVDTLEKNLGLEGHQRVVVEHVKHGRQHYHIIWNRVDVETLRVADMGGNWPIHEKTSRELEARFDLTPTPTNAKTFDTKSAPELYEIRAAERSGIDPKAVKAELTELWRNSENGKAFAAALEERGYILAKGDRRDFCVIDKAGDAHSLARRLDGVRAKDVREHMADIDGDALPSVQEARATQKSIERAQMKPELGPTAADIRLAWNLTDSGASFVARIDDRGWSLALVSPDEARSSERVHAFAREVGRYAPYYREGEIVVVNGYGNVHRIDERTTGSTRPEIEKNLACVDTQTLLNVADTREVMKEASREHFESKRAEGMLKYLERKEAAEAAAHERWEARAEAARARIDPVIPSDIVTRPGLAVFDAASGLADSLVDFVAGMSGDKSKPEFSSAASAEQIVAQRKAIAALERISESMERGDRLDASDIRCLTPTHIDNIKRHGDDYMRQLIDDLQRDRAHQLDYGRARER